MSAHHRTFWLSIFLALLGDCACAPIHRESGINTREVLEEKVTNAHAAGVASASVASDSNELTLLSRRLQTFENIGEQMGNDEDEDPNPPLSPLPRPFKNLREDIEGLNEGGAISPPTSPFPRPFENLREDVENLNEGGDILPFPSPPPKQFENLRECIEGLNEGGAISPLTPPFPGPFENLREDIKNLNEGGDILPFPSPPPKQFENLRECIGNLAEEGEDIGEQFEDMVDTIWRRSEIVGEYIARRYENVGGEGEDIARQFVQLGKDIMRLLENIPSPLPLLLLPLLPPLALTLPIVLPLTLPLVTPFALPYLCLLPPPLRNELEDIWKKFKNELNRDYTEPDPGYNGYNGTSPQEIPQALRDFLAVVHRPRRSLLHEELSNKSRTLPSVDLVISRYTENITWLLEVEKELPMVRILVYEKGGVESACETIASATCTAVENVGREAYVYLTHIVENFERLADKTVFMQAAAPGYGFVPAAASGHLVTGSDFFYDYASPLVPPRMVLSYLSIQSERSFVHLAREDFVMPWGRGRRNEIPSKCPSESEWMQAHVVYNSRAPFWTYALSAQPDQKTSSDEYWDSYLSSELGPRPKYFLFAQGATFSVSSARIRSHPISFYQLLLATTTKWNLPLSAYYLEMFWPYILESASTLRDCADAALARVKLMA